MTELERWEGLLMEKRFIEREMCNCLKRMIGKRIRFRVSNMSRPADAVIVFVDSDGECVRVRNLETGKCRRIYPLNIVGEAEQ